jgi:23S rRNA pseudouridine1911/1915/1917 synthase
MPDFVVEEQQSGMRLDAFLAAAAGISRVVAARAIAEGRVNVEGEPAAKSMRVGAGMQVSATLELGATGPLPESIAVPVVYSDEHLVVVAKPAGLVVHPAPGHAGGTLVNALLASADDVPVGGEDEDRPGIVHRLDASTSGLMVVAKSNDAHARLVEMMAAREVSRIYIVLVEGALDSDSATIDAPIGRSPKHRKKMAVVAGGKTAITHVEVTERLKGCTLLDARLETGRTHQIRVHLAAAGHPVLGDSVYGHGRGIARDIGLDRPFLHAARLSFAHPITGKPLAFEEPMPADLTEALERARELL